MPAVVAATVVPPLAVVVAGAVVAIAVVARRTEVGDGEADGQAAIPVSNDAPITVVQRVVAPPIVLRRSTNGGT